MYFVYIYNSLVGLLDDPSSRLKQYFATETLTHIDSDQSPSSDSNMAMSVSLKNCDWIGLI